MQISPAIREVFGYFQNLNLLVLVQDLGRDQTARHAWSTGSLLCPIAHGLPAGQHVRQLSVLGQAADLEDGCDYAAHQLGANPMAVLRFVRSWDDEVYSRTWLLGQLQAIWEERLADAKVMQHFLHETSAVLNSTSALR